MNVEVKKYSKPDGYMTRFWAVYVEGDLLVVTVYRKGAEAVAKAITSPKLTNHHVTTVQDSTDGSSQPPPPGVATYKS